MTAGQPQTPVAEVSAAALGRLMPMFLWLGAQGEIRAVGPTLAKVCGSSLGLVGQPFAEHFTITSPHHATVPTTMRALAGKRLHLTPRREPGTGLRGLAVPVGPAAQGGVLFNLSFGVGIAEAVRDHGLTDTDFAPTELAMELLYLQEAKAAVMSELLALNARLQTAQRAAEAQALSDPLTGLANRRALERELARTAAETARGGASFALAHIDLDHFKAVNDTLGHAAGDHVLIHVADVLRAEARRSDLVARVGGDEFVLLLRGAIDLAVLQALGERVITRLEAPFAYEGAPCRISASIGIALSQCYDPPDAERMATDADAALYAAKRGGRGRCIVLGQGAPRAASSLAAAAAAPPSA
ncbi:MAG: GGDEF domain-containing protein [Alphaproteobacteria bacterium HGW-Alphaproteobacteria-4]|nr:MAG: GGDEF domain-containing protein [Alphaproteobacteria bacterium HGW-Alphaproteobacteria-4]